MDKNKNDLTDNLDYEVMPNLTGAGPRLAADIKPAASPAVPPRAGRHWNLRIISISAAGVLLFAGISLWAYWKYVVNYNPGGEVPASTANNIVVPPPVSNTDTDNDGLTNQREQELATDPTKADTDNDGLADGDEANIYHSDPLLPDTDNDGFQDGQEVKDGYSPTSDSKDKASAEETRAWADREAQYGLHEPTKATLRGTAEESATFTRAAAVYTNAAFKYSTALPNLLEVRESGDKRNVGFRIKGAVVDDDDVTTDPIFITAAVNAGGSLREWVDGQYQLGTDYESLQEIKINNLDAIKITGVSGEVCAGNKVFLARDTAVLVLTWQCNNIQAFGQLFDQIVQSFKFE